MQSSTLAFYSFVALGLCLVAWLMLEPAWHEARRRRLRSRPFPAAWRAILRRRVPLFARLPARLQLRLKQDMLVFLAEKPFVGCAGLQVKDEMRVTVAALACMPLLGARRGYYPKLHRILLYPDAFVADQMQSGAGGVQHTGGRVLLGESWARGQVILSWADVLQGAADPHDGSNVVIHEFAHQLDQIKGYASGAPPLRGRLAYRRWSERMQSAFDTLRLRLEQGEEDLLGSYAATDPAEFFAVCSEVFFERAAELNQRYPQLFTELCGFYRINPLSWN